MYPELVTRGDLDVFLPPIGGQTIYMFGDPKKLAEALETTEVQENAKTAFLSRYNFSSDNHGPNPDTSELKFISPTKILNGQFGNPAAS